MPVDDQRAGQDVGAFHRDADGNADVRAPDDVPGPPADGGAGEHVHGVVDDGAHVFRQVGLDDGGQHGGFLARVHGAAGEDPGGVHVVRPGGGAGQGLLDALEAADGHVELLAHGAVGAGRPHRQLGGAHRQRRQRDRAALRQAFHEHAPALAYALPAADDGVHGHEHARAEYGAVGKGDAHGVVMPADVNAGQAGRDQGTRDAQVFLAAQQPVGIEGAEGQADDGGDRGQGDVALRPVEAEAEDFLAFVGIPADDAGAAGGRRVAAGLGLGEGEARDVLAPGQAGQVVILLLVRPVVQQQFPRPQGVGNHDDDGGGQAAAGNLGDDGGVRDGRITAPAVFLGDAQAEEALLFQELPGVGREVPILGDLPVVDHGAELLDGSVEEGAFGLRQGLGPEVEQLPPIRIAGKQIPVPPHRARLQRDALGVADAGKGLAHQAQNRLGDHLSANGGNAEQQRHGGSDGGHGDEKRSGLDPGGRPGEQAGRGQRHPGPEPAAGVEQPDEKKRPDGGDEHGHVECLLFCRFNSSAACLFSACA